MKYRECEYCGATLDAGERCDCRETGEAYVAEWLNTAEYQIKFKEIKDGIKSNNPKI